MSQAEFAQPKLNPLNHWKDQRLGFAVGQLLVMEEDVPIKLFEPGKVIHLIVYRYWQTVHGSK